MLRTLTSRQVAGWLAFYQIEHEDSGLTAEQLLARKAAEKLSKRKRR